MKRSLDSYSSSKRLATSQNSRAAKRPRRKTKRARASTSYQTLEPRRLLATLSDFSILSHAETMGYYATDATSISAGTVESYTVNLYANQTLSVRAVGTGTLAPTITVSAPGGSSLGMDGSGGSSATLQSLPVAVAGHYVITVSGFNSTEGDYQIDVILNATFESEVGDGNANETLATAEPIIGWKDPGDYFATPIETEAEIATTVASFADEGVIFGDDFESGSSLNSRWQTSSSTSSGSIEITDAVGASSGSYALVMSSDQSGVDNLNEAILDISDVVFPALSFDYTQWNDEVQPLPSEFTGSVDGDGISISNDGIQWYSIFDLSPTLDGEWGAFPLDLGVAAYEAGMQGSVEYVKFQQFGNSTLLDDGRAFDNIKVHSTYSFVVDFNPDIAIDWFSIEVTEEQSLSIASRRTNGRRVIDGGGIDGPRLDTLSRTRIALFDSEGELLETGTDPSIESYGYDSQINNYTAAPGTYYVRINGVGYEEYVLVTAKNLDVPEMNNGRHDLISSLGSDQARLGENEYWSNNRDISSFGGVDFQEAISGGPIFHVHTLGAYIPPTGNGVYASAVDSPEGFQEGVNELRADFDSPVRKVRIDVGSDDAADSAFLRAYSSTGVLLEEVTSRLIPKSNVESLVIDRVTADIAYIVAAGTDGDPTPLDHLEYFEVGYRGIFPSYELDVGETIKVSLVAIGAGPDAPGLSNNTTLRLYSGGDLLLSGTDSIVYQAVEEGNHQLQLFNTSPESFGGFFLKVEIIPVAYVDNAAITYKGSAWDDGSDLFAAQPTDKSYFFNGQTAQFENYTTYSAGINNILVDVFRPSPYLNIDDFTFKVGATDDTSTWADAPTPAMTVHEPAFEGGVSTISFDWPDGSITNTWLQVKAIANPLNAFANDVTFYFGNVVGETGNNLANTKVDLIDVGITRANQSGFFTVPIDYVLDFNRDKRVNLVDVAIARSNQTGFFSLPLITPFENSSASGKSGSEGNEQFGRNDSKDVPQSFSYVPDDHDALLDDEKVCLRSELESLEPPAWLGSAISPAVQTVSSLNRFSQDAEVAKKQRSEFHAIDMDRVMTDLLASELF